MILPPTISGSNANPDEFEPLPEHVREFMASYRGAFANYVVTVVDPIDSIKKMYLEKVNGSNGSDNQVSSSEE